MFEVVGGILIAVVVLMLVAVFFRAIVLLIVFGIMAAIGAVFVMTAPGRELLPAVVAACVLGTGVWAVSRALDRRDDQKAAASGWRRVDR